MTRTAVFIVGAPAAGKTTLARRLLRFPSERSAAHVAVTARPLPLFTVTRSAPWVCAAGHYTGATFDGADRVPYHGAAAALEHWRETYSRLPGVLSIFDGDRFSHTNAIRYVMKNADRVVCVLLRAPDEVLAERRAARDWNPNPAWLLGRATKAQRVFESFEDPDRVELDGTAEYELPAFLGVNENV